MYYSPIFFFGYFTEMDIATKIFLANMAQDKKKVVREEGGIRAKRLREDAPSMAPVLANDESQGSEATPTELEAPALPPRKLKRASQASACKVAPSSSIFGASMGEAPEMGDTSGGSPMPSAI